MNRKERRANLKRGGLRGDQFRSPSAQSLTTEELLARARLHHQQRQPELARDAADRILAREPGHVPALNLLGLIYQETGRHRLAAKALSKAVISDPLNAACHYNLGTSHLALDNHDSATVHFKKAIVLGMSRRSIEDFIFQNPAITACLARIEQNWPVSAKADGLLGSKDLDTFAADVFLRCALELVLVRTEPLERFLTVLRSTLLQTVYASLGQRSLNENITALLCAVAQQCFINEYVFAQSEEETRQSTQLRDLLLQDSFGEGADSTPLLAAVAAYFPLYRLTNAKGLAGRRWPFSADDLVRQQLTEPLAEAADMASIPTITPVEDSVSRDVMRQYEESPYPRWTINPFAGRADEHEGSATASAIANAKLEILIAGCGTGQHAFQIAHYFPEARMLAIDISLPSLAYAKRKTREEGLLNVDYAQADILTLGKIGRSFDRIEVVGVLHHLADPESGWRALLSLLKHEGEMRVGLYSETARKVIVDVRAYIAERDLQPTAEGIRKCRQEITREADARHWTGILEKTDFYSMSGCRDLLFHVMEHRFTIPRIKSFLNEHQLAFEGFELEPPMLESFRSRFPAGTDITDLDKWDVFESENPQTFRHMYVFNVRKALE